jgi:hypothetical protein
MTGDVVFLSKNSLASSGANTLAEGFANAVIYSPRPIRNALGCGKLGSVRIPDAVKE